MRLIRCAILGCTLFVVAACSQNDSAEPELITYVGDMYVDMTPGFVGADGTDRVQLTVDNLLRYSLLNFTGISRNPFPPICESQGIIRNFGGDTLRFVSEDTLHDGTCSTRVPNGLFVQVRRPAADSLIIESIPGDITFFRFSLRRVSTSQAGAPTGS
jgi:hypothetical protein